MDRRKKRPGRPRTRESRKIDWFFNRRLGPWQLSGIDCLMRRKEYNAALYLILVTVEALSGFREGGNPAGASFESFIDAYFPEILLTRVRNPLYRSRLIDPETSRKREISYAEILRSFFRGGFEESCAAFPGVSIAKGSRYYCRFYAKVGLRIDIGRFHTDFVAACAGYQSEVISDYFVRRRFIRRFDSVFGKRRRPRGRRSRG